MFSPTLAVSGINFTSKWSIHAANTEFKESIAEVRKDNKSFLDIFIFYNYI
jgi:hypothetical protein